MLDLFCTQPWKIMPCLGRMHLGRRAILKLSCFPRQNRWKKRGIAIIPTKFGISFTVPFLNQVGKHPIFLLRQPMGRWWPSSYKNRIPMLHVFANFGNSFFLQRLHQTYTVILGQILSELQNDWMSAEGSNYLYDLIFQSVGPKHLVFWLKQKILLPAPDGTTSALM